MLKHQTQKGHKQFFKQIAVGFGLAGAISIVVSVVSYQNITKITETSIQAAQTQKVIEELEEVLSQVEDAETRQRGYIVTGKDNYLEPYHAAIKVIAPKIKEIRKLLIDNPKQQQRLDALESLIAKKLFELKQTIDLRRNKGFTAASHLVMTDQGKNLMAQIRICLHEIENEIYELLKQRSQAALSRAQDTIFVFSGGTLVDFFIFAGVYYLIYREISERKRVEEPINLLQTLMLAISECGDFDQAVEVVLSTVCETKSWNYAEMWFPCPDKSNLEVVPELEEFTNCIQAFLISRSFEQSLNISDVHV